MFESTILWVIIGVIGVVAVLLLASRLFLVKQPTAAIVKHFGKMVRKVGPGLNAKLPFIGSVAARINQRVQQLDVKIESQTEDKLLVRMVVAVQFYVLPEESSDAHYKLDEAQRQITSHVIEMLRGQVPGIKLDELLDTKEEIADQLKAELDPVMDSFGYGILRVVLNDINPEEAKIRKTPNRNRR